MPRGVRVLLASAVLLVGCGGDGEQQSASCEETVGVSRVASYYRVEPGRLARDTARAVCDRLRAFGEDDAHVVASGDRIRVAAPAEAASAVAVATQRGELRFYDWEPNVRGDRGPDAPYSGRHALFDAVRVASRSRSKAQGGEYYLFDASRKPIGDPSRSCKALLARYERRAGSRKYARGTACAEELKALGAGGPPAGSSVVEIPRGIAVVEAERAANQPETVQRYFVIQDDPDLTGSDIVDPKESVDNVTNEPVLAFHFTAGGRKAFAAVTKREAERGAREGTPQRFAIVVDDRVVSLATIDYQTLPEGIDGKSGAQIQGLGGVEQIHQLAVVLKMGPLPAEATPVSKR